MALRLTRVLKGYRIVDLSERTEPGKALGPDGRLRWFFTRVFPYPQPGGEWMRDIVMESHISTHVEGPSHYVDAIALKEGVGKDLSQLPLISYFGEAVLVKCDKIPDNSPITVDHLKDAGVREGDIVIIGLSGRAGQAAPYMSDEATRWLADLPIKMIGFDRTIGIENRVRLSGVTDARERLEGMLLHKMMCENDIPIIEVLANLEQLKRTRFFLFAFPAYLTGLESFPIRAVAFEPLDET